MYIPEPITLTAQYIENDSRRNEQRMLLEANFQDYLDSAAEGGKLQVKSGKIKMEVTSVLSGAGMAAGALLGGPAGLSTGFVIGNRIGKYLGGVLATKVYGQAISDMNQITGTANQRQIQIAAYLSFVNQVDGAIDSMRQNENKRKKAEIDSMAA